LNRRKDYWGDSKKKRKTKKYIFLAELIKCFLMWKKKARERE